MKSRAFYRDGAQRKNLGRKEAHEGPITMRMPYITGRPIGVVHSPENWQGGERLRIPKKGPDVDLGQTIRMKGQG